MTLREQLEAKKRRKAVVPVLVSDATEDGNQLAAYQHAHALAVEAGRDADAALLLVDIEDQVAKVRAHWVDVELVALPPAEWEAAVAAWQTIQVQDDGPTAVIDWTEGLPHLLALSCTDESMNDPEVWKTLITGGAWNEGEVDSLKRAILHLNVDAADPHVPKG
ncbi:MAG TPA: hypothetical protein VIQ30_23195 [Pseudonocardia sp.]